MDERGIAILSVAVAVVFGVAAVALDVVQINLGLHTHQADEGTGAAVTIPPARDPPRPDDDAPRIPGEYAAIDPKGGMGGALDPVAPGERTSQTPTQPQLPITAQTNEPISAPVRPVEPTASNFVLERHMIVGVPTGRELRRYYPRSASARGREGQLWLRCRGHRDGRMDCRAIGQGESFRAAGRNLSRSMRVSPQFASSIPEGGAEIMIPLRFDIIE